MGAALGAAVGGPAWAAGATNGVAQTPGQLSLDDLRGFARVVGIEFTEAELKEVLRDVQGELPGLQDLRRVTDDQTLPPATSFRVRGLRDHPNPRVDVRVPTPSHTIRPSSDDDLLFLTIPELGTLLRRGEVSSLELTRVAIARLQRFGEPLHCVVELTADRALREARRADEELESGYDRGPLHGIPYGLKDLFAVRGTRTQWGTAAYRHQRIPEDSAVYERLREAGAVLVAKLSLGALAMNDVWFGGMTRNPWNPAEGSSGSSAGSASSVAAGLLPFAIGTETSGSIVSPTHRCRVTGLRPTFGRVSRYGAMSLAWSMDKVGPIARTAEDALLVLAALVGVDARDAATISQPLVYRRPRSLRGLRVGISGDAPKEVVEQLHRAGVTTAPFRAPATPGALGAIIGVESAAMFDKITRDGRLKEVTENEWPQFFRAARFTGAVEYAQCDRLRGRLMEQWATAAEGFDCLLANDTAAAWIYALNLIGWPQILVPRGPSAQGKGQSVSLVGPPLSEPRLVGVAAHLQAAFGAHRLRPDLTSLTPGPG